MQGQAHVAIFWDYENCHAPSLVSGHELVDSIRQVGHRFGEIKLFKAYLELPEQSSPRFLALRSELQSSGVSLTDCPHNGRKNVADQMIIVDMLTHIMDNPAPLTVVLISGDRDFAYALSVLRLRRYQVVLISPSLPPPHTSLKAQASVVLDWNADVMSRVNADLPQSHPSSVSPTLTGPILPSTPTLSRPRDVETLSSPQWQRYQRTELLSGPAISSPVPRRSAGVAARIPVGGSLSPSIIHHDDLIKCRGPAPTYTKGPRSILGQVVRTTSVPPLEILQAAITPVPSNNTPHPLVISTNGPPLKPSSYPIVSSFNTPNPATGLDTAIPPSIETPIRAVRAVSPPTAAPLMSMMSPVPYSDSAPQHFTPVPQPGVPPIPKVLPEQFLPLARSIEAHRLEGFAKCFRSQIALDVISKDKKVYEKANAPTFKIYSTLAEAAGIVVLGGKAGDAWISLHPDWHGKVP